MKLCVRTDWFDISDEALDNIEDKEFLTKEYDHNNKLLQQMQADISRFLQWLYGAIIVATGAFISRVYDISLKVVEQQDVFLPIIKTLLQFLFELSGIAFIVCIPFLIIHVLSNHLNRKKIVKRKEQILKLLEKSEK